MIEIRNTGLKVEMETVDGITVPASVMSEARTMAKQAHKCFFVAPIEKPNHAYKPKPTIEERMAQFRAGDRSFMPTGMFVISDDHETVKELGSSGMIWVTPNA